MLKFKVSIRIKKKVDLKWQSISETADPLRFSHTIFKLHTKWSEKTNYPVSIGSLGNVRGEWANCFKLLGRKRTSNNCYLAKTCRGASLNAQHACTWGHQNWTIEGWKRCLSASRFLLQNWDGRVSIWH